MAQDYGAFQPIADLAQKWGVLGKTQPGAIKEDKAWEDDQVRKANESFRVAAQKKLTPEGPKLGQRKRAAKKTAKQTARK